MLIKLDSGVIEVIMDGICMKKREDTEMSKHKRVRHLSKFDSQLKRNSIQYRSLWREEKMENECLNIFLILL